MSPSVNLTIDGKFVEVEAGTSVLDAAKSVGIEIPTLCHHPKLKPFTSCFICVVESVNMKGKLIPACSTIATDGMYLLSNSPKVQQSRKVCVELLLSDHTGDCLAPCQIACPAGTPIPGYVEAIGKDDYKTAIKLIKSKVPFAASVGRVCPRPCESACRRTNLEDPVAICNLKRYAADLDLASGDPYLPEVGPDTGKKVAIIGAGPAGLTCAYFLRQKGHAVTVFDRHERAGGMLAWGIPDFRLPPDILDGEIKAITDLGIEMKYEVDFGTDITIDSLKAEGYDAIYLAIGAQGVTAMRVEGEHARRVYSGVELLDNCAMYDPPHLGQKTVVVGGGSTAVDCARTARRLGVPEVILMYRRTRNEMPAHSVEVDDAIKEGVILMELTAPTKIESFRLKLDVTAIKMELGKPDDSGRRSPVPMPNSEFVIRCDSLVSAIGQAVHNSCLAGSKVECTKWGTLKVNQLTFMTTEQGVFAGGDCAVDGDRRIAVEAVGMGRRAAESINIYLTTGAFFPVTNEFSVKISDLANVPKEIYKDVKPQDREKMAELSVEKRLSSEFPEVELGYSHDQAVNEAQRCLHCGCAEQDTCRIRKYAFEYSSQPERWKGDKRQFEIDDSHKVIEYESGKCILCGACVRVCAEVKGIGALCFAGRGFPTRVRPNFNSPWGSSTCDGCKMCVEVCPTGAILEHTEDGRLLCSCLTKSELSNTK